ncbi:SDR family oxidoreductase [Pseudomaricurvus alkylphenolicus]|uniref:SDR family NAD(P)-dependent oxidoreductase n=1 Tax=Pseudomaricurvus alkylphenolicus TaxID=1306991 RepID=UPI001423BAA6|nr:SDR family NAD(P)-dependent oxidoreductase [Pseudomaricurvus alkylphenolicus]NIB43542.1 SDR family oxidoreductase [Pseudomaricurvus alkylphenolicus]
MFDLTGHVALITGGNGGLGLAFARGLVKSGASVAVWGRNPEKNGGAISELRDLGGDVEAFQVDVTDSTQINTAFEATIERFGKVDVCFANAGGPGFRGYLHQTSEQDWQSAIDLNINAVVNTFKPVIARLVETQSPGKLIVTSSAAALMGTGFSAGYATTKAAVVGLARSLAVELGGHGIQANALLPGYVETEFVLETSQAFKDAARRRSCLPRRAQAEDMEGVAVFLASRHSDFMTGHALVMDGGHTVHPL